MKGPRDILGVGKLDLELLRGLLSALPADESVVVGSGIGCDVAVIDAGPGDYLLLKSDPVTFATDEIGRYAVTVNVNDIATSGGLPRWFLATLLLPEAGSTPALVREILGQITRACEDYGVLLVGGHTEVTHGLDRPVVAGALVGQVARDGLVTSRGTQAGDLILLTKAVAIEGACIIAREKRRELLAAGFTTTAVNECADLLHQPGIGVLAEARAICDSVRVHAMHDPTEGGLATGLWEMAVAGGVSMRIDRSAIPVLPQTWAMCRHFGLEPLGLIASGSLLAAVAASDASSAIRSCSDRGIPCTVIGEAVSPVEGRACVWDEDGGELPRYDQDEIGKVFA